MRLKNWLVILAFLALIPLGNIAFGQNASDYTSPLKGLLFEQIGSGGLTDFTFGENASNVSSQTTNSSTSLANNTATAPINAVTNGSSPSFLSLSIKSLTVPGLVSNDQSGNLIGGQKINANDIVTSSLLAGNGISLSGNSLDRLIGANDLTISLDKNVPTSIVGDSNVQGSIEDGTLKLAWDGILPVSRGGTGVDTFGKPGQVLVVNSTGTGLEYKDASAAGITTTTNSNTSYVIPGGTVISAIIDGTVPGQTAVWNGANWVSSGALTNDGTDIGVTNNLTVGGTINGAVINAGLVNNWNNAVQPGDNVSSLNNDANYIALGDNISGLTNDANYIANGDNISLLNNDAGYLTSIAGLETDPIYSASTAATITPADILNWNSALQSGDNISLLNNNANYLTAATLPAAETDPLSLKMANNLSDLTNVNAAKTSLGLDQVLNVAQLPASALDTDVTLAANSDANVASQKAVKSYVDNSIAANNNLADTLIWVGNGGGVAAPVALSGDAILADTGTLTLNNASVTGQNLTGFVAGGAGAINAADTILSGLQKAQAQINALVTHPAATVDAAGQANGLSITVPQVLTLATANGVGQNGALTSADWNTFNNKQTSVLANGSILVGNVGNVATPVAVSGDATLSNAGVLTLTNASVTGQPLTGFVAGTNPGTITNANTILSGLQAAQNQIDALGAVSHVAATIGTANGLSLAGQAISLQLATAGQNGALSSADWTTFNNKQNALIPGNVSTSTAGVTVANGAGATVGPNVTIDVINADGTHTGLLTSADWTTFNNKQNTALANGLIWVGSAGGVATAQTMSGDATIANTGAVTLANSGAAAGIYGHTVTNVPDITVDAKGRITSVSDRALANTDVGLGNVLNVAQLPASYLDTDGTLTANSDIKVASQKATKTYVDTGLTTKQGTALASGLIWVGNGLGTAAPVAMSGEATIANTGAVTLDNNSVIGKVLAGLVTPNTAIANGDSIVVALGEAQGQINNLAATKQNNLIAGNSISIVGNTIDTVQDIRATASPTFNGLTLNSVTVGADTLTDLTGTGLVNAAGTLNVTLAPFTTTNLAEGANLYYTTPRATTDARNAMSVSTPLTYNSGTGAFAINQAGLATDGYLSSADWNTFNNKQNTALANGLIWVGNGVGTAAPVAMSGDATIANTGAVTLAASGAGAGTYGNAVTNVPQITVDAKGRVTSISNRVLSSTDVGLGNVLNVAQIPAAALDTDATLFANSDAKVASQKAVKTYVDTGLATKQNNLTFGNVTTATPGVTIGNGVGSVIGAAGLQVDIQNATTAQNGLLTSADWNTFNNKQNTALANGLIWVGNAVGVAAPVTVSGDATLSNAGVLTLANSGAAAGTYGNTVTNIPQITVDAQGRITNVSDRSLTSNDVGLGNVLNVAQIPAAALDTDGTLSANSDAKVASQKATKTYVDTGIAASDATDAANLAAGLATKQNANLADSLIWVGVAGTPTATAVSGDATLNNTGALTLNNASVTGQNLTGFVAGGAGAINAADTILSGLQKAQAQINALVTHPAATVDAAGQANGLSITVPQVLTIATAGPAQNGALSSADWTTFNGKQAALTFGNITSPNAAITVTNGNASTVGPNVTIDVVNADGTHTGLLTAADWTTFSGKQNALPVGTAAQYLRGNQTLGTLDTSVVPENGNLYYTDARVSANVDVAANTADRHVAATVGTANGLSIAAGQVVSLAAADTATTGALTSADWNTFNNKQNALVIGNATTPNAAITITGGNGAVIGAGLTVDVRNATTAQSGLLTAADWNTFNGKQNALAIGDLTSPTAGVNVAGGVGSVIGAGASISIQNATTAQNGLLTSADWNTFNNKQNTALANGLIWVGNAGGNAAPVTVSGDATLSNAGVLTLANSGAVAGTYGNTVTNIPNITVDAKGRVTSISNRALTSNDVGLGNVLNVAQIPASALSTDGTLAANSDANVSSQKAVKTYVDTGLATKQGNLTAGSSISLVGNNINTIQDIRTTASPTFAGLTINGNIATTGTVDGTDISVKAPIWDAKQNALTFGTISSPNAAVTVTNGANSTVGPNVSIDIVNADGTHTGLLKSADWTTFNNKQNALTFGNATTTTSGVTIGNGTGSVIGAAGLQVNIANANGTQNGLLTSADWSTFNNKQNALTIGNLTSPTAGVNVAGGVGSVIGAGASISIQNATTAQNGLLTSADWNTFNNKQNALTIGNATTPNAAVTITGGTGAVIGAGLAVDVRNATTAQSGLLTSADWNTFNGKQNALTFGNATTTTSGVTIGNGTGSVIGAAGLQVNIANASATQNGLLTSADWSTFNNKQNALTIGNVTTTTSGVNLIGGTNAVIGGGLTLNINTASANQNGLLSSTDWATFNNKQNTLTFGNGLVNSSGTISVNFGATSTSAVRGDTTIVIATPASSGLTGGTTITLGSGGTTTLGLNLNTADLAINASGQLDTTQSLASTASPTFAGLTTTTALTSGVSDPTTGIVNGLTISRNVSTGVGAVGEGTGLSFKLETGTEGSMLEAGKIATVWSDLTSGSVDSTVKIYGWDNGTYKSLFEVGDGQIKMADAYSSTVGVPNLPLYVDSTGKVGILPSSERYKHDITDMENIDWLYNLNPVNYVYNSDTTDTKQYGLIAEDVEKVNPLLVNYDTNGDGLPETVNYNEFIPILIKAAQDQNTQIKGLTASTDQLGLKLTDATTSLATALTTISTQQDQINNLQSQINNLTTNVANAIANGTAVNVPSAPTAPVTTDSSDSDIVNLTTALNALTTQVNSISVDMTALKNAIAINAMTGDISLNGHVLVNADTAGKATIKKDDTKIDITFAKPYATAPIVNATPLDFITGQYKISNVTVNGFTIEVSEAQADDADFNWTALGNN